jgi:deoxyhypusine synthase
MVINGSETPWPETAAAAVLMKSENMPAGSQKVEELDFNAFAGSKVTVEDLIEGMTNMGFQASSVGEAVKIINSMVSTSALILSIMS